MSKIALLSTVPNILKVEAHKDTKVSYRMWQRQWYFPLLHGPNKWSVTVARPFLSKMLWSVFTAAKFMQKCPSCCGHVNKYVYFLSSSVQFQYLQSFLVIHLQSQVNLKLFCLEYCVQGTCLRLMNSRFYVIWTIMNQFETHNDGILSQKGNSKLLRMAS